MIVQQKITTYKPKPIKSVFYPCGPDFQVLVDFDKPNWFWRLFQYLLLGWKWEDYEENL